MSPKTIALKFWKLTISKIIKGTTTVYRAMNAGPLICTLETELDEVRRMMVDHHARYLPVIDKQMLQGVISSTTSPRRWSTGRISRTAC